MSCYIAYLPRATNLPETFQHVKNLFQPNVPYPLICEAEIAAFLDFAKSCRNSQHLSSHPARRAYIEGDGDEASDAAFADQFAPIALCSKCEQAFMKMLFVIKTARERQTAAIAATAAEAKEDMAAMPSSPPSTVAATAAAAAATTVAATNTRGLSEINSDAIIIESDSDEAEAAATSSNSRRVGRQSAILSDASPRKRSLPHPPRPPLASLQSTSSTSASISLHDRKQTKQPRLFNCSFCTKSFTRKFTLDAHIRTHLDVRNHKCSLCGLAFVRLHDMKSHERNHTKSKAFRCGKDNNPSQGGCGRRFERSSHLLRHWRSTTGQKCKARLAAAAAEGQTRGSNERQEEKGEADDEEGRDGENNDNDDDNDDDVEDEQSTDDEEVMDVIRSRSHSTSIDAIGQVLGVLTDLASGAGSGLNRRRKSRNGVRHPPNQSFLDAAQQMLAIGF